MEFEIHKFDSEKACINAIERIDEHYGFNGNQTVSFQEPKKHNDFWYIYADEESKAVLGHETELIDFSDEKF